jgi:hypothetical protein
MAGILDPDEKLRQLLGESIPTSGSDADTLFSDDEIDDLLGLYSSLDEQVYQGWKIKAAKLSNLVDTTEGPAQRKFSQLLTGALEMTKVYESSRAGGDDFLQNRARVGKIRRGYVRPNTLRRWR